jgi:general stress protein 26
MSDRDSFEKNLHIEDFLKRNHIAVLATANKQTGEPHAATIYYAPDSKMNIFFVTKKGTTKSQNLDSNPRAALAIYEADSQRTAQIRGSAGRIEDKATIEKALRIMSNFSEQTANTNQIPLSKIDAGEYILYRLSPDFIRLAEYRYGVYNEIFDVATPVGESLE